MQRYSISFVDAAVSNLTSATDAVVAGSKHMIDPRTIILPNSAATDNLRSSNLLQVASANKLTAEPHENVSYLNTPMDPVSLIHPVYRRWYGNVTKKTPAGNCDPMNISSQPVSAVHSVRFSLLPSSLVRAMSVTEIVSSQYTGAGTLADLRMGPAANMSQRIQCQTCGLNYSSCPSHCGHMNIPATINHMYASFVTHVMNCVCLACHRVLVLPGYAFLKLGIQNLRKPVEERNAVNGVLRQCNGIVQKIKHCPRCLHPRHFHFRAIHDEVRIFPINRNASDVTTESCPIDHVYHQPTNKTSGRVRKNAINIIATAKQAVGGSLSNLVSGSFVLCVLQQIPISDFSLLGIDGVNNHPIGTVFSAFPVLTSTMRPSECMPLPRSAGLGGMRAQLEDDEPPEEDAGEDEVHESTMDAVEECPLDDDAGIRITEMDMLDQTTLIQDATTMDDGLMFTIDDEDEDETAAKRFRTAEFGDAQLAVGVVELLNTMEEARAPVLQLSVQQKKKTDASKRQQQQRYHAATAAMAAAYRILRCFCVCITKTHVRQTRGLSTVAGWEEPTPRCMRSIVTAAPNDCAGHLSHDGCECTPHVSQLPEKPLFSKNCGIVKRSSRTSSLSGIHAKLLATSSATYTATDRFFGFPHLSNHSCNALLPHTSRQSGQFCVPCGTSKSFLQSSRASSTKTRSSTYSSILRERLMRWTHMNATNFIHPLFAESRDCGQLLQKNCPSVVFEFPVVPLYPLS